VHAGGRERGYLFVSVDMIPCFVPGIKPWRPDGVNPYVGMLFRPE
jgi:hypothetical protein